MTLSHPDTNHDPELTLQTKLSPFYQKRLDLNSTLVNCSNVTFCFMVLFPSSFSSSYNYRFNATWTKPCKLKWDTKTFISEGNRQRFKVRVVWQLYAQPCGFSHICPARSLMKFCTLCPGWDQVWDPCSIWRVNIVNNFFISQKFAEKEKRPWG